ncbi:hypothetical protein [Streptomyces chiangmaiensis]|uniref:Uncharacterized protein n=1 Tax=Streptomyces chiangmaiensis TaxID=766497 RepID=A0ABU7FWX9_9ACTN|nr:hypothetical protein [Streptomyces chiangmaiensis]MED7828632.1 hypothetical protein [Streptomyces chiangmaiensis]
MGKWLSGDGVPGRPGVHPDGAESGRWDGHDDSALETALAAVMRGGDLDPRAEQQAVAAFRTARAAGAHRARTRRRDDWRLPAERRTGHPVKTTLGVVFASIALGGVAVAAIGSVGSSADGAGRGTANPSAVTSDRPGGGTASSRGLGPTKHPATAKDTEAHCRAYEQTKNRGKALEATAWQRLVAAAGGEDKVTAYCSERLARATAEPNKPGSQSKPGAGAADSGRGQGGSTGDSGNHPSGADNASGNAKAGDISDNGK